MILLVLPLSVKNHLLTIKYHLVKGMLSDHILAIQFIWIRLKQQEFLK